MNDTANTNIHDLSIRIYRRIRVLYFRKIVFRIVKVGALLLSSGATSYASIVLALPAIRESGVFALLGLLRSDTSLIFSQFGEYAFALLEVLPLASLVIIVVALLSLLTTVLQFGNIRPMNLITRSN